MEKKNDNSDSKTREKFYPYYGWRPIDAKIDKC